jgi:hypothetical protein
LQHLVLAEGLSALLDALAHGVSLPAEAAVVLQQALQGERGVNATGPLS